MTTRRRGFTTIELLVAMGMFLSLAALVAGGVRPQAHHAGSQIRLSAMQQGTRAAFDLLARDLRMAGYGIDLTMPGVPAPITTDETLLLTVNANFANVKTKGSGAGSTVVVNSASGFAVDNYLVIESFWGGEAKKITGVSANAIQLAQPLSRIYATNSDVTQIEAVTYQMAFGTVLRNGQPMLDGVQTLGFQYYLDDGTLVTDPAGVDEDIRSTLVSIDAHAVNSPVNAVGEDMSFQAEVRIRNLGLSEVER